MPAGTIGSPRSCSYRCKIEGGRYTRSCEVTHPSARRQGGSSSVRRGTRLPASPATCGQPFRGHRCTHCWCHGRASRKKRPRPCSLTGWRRWRRPSASGSVPGWHGTSRHSGSGPAWCRRWALVRGTMVRSPDGKSDPWLQVYANHPAVGNVMGWPGEVLPVLQQPLCSLPILAVAVVLDVGTLWLYDRQLR